MSNFSSFIINRDAITEAGKYIESALEIAQRGDNQALISNALAAKGGLFLASGDHLVALDYCERVLKTSPHHILALHNRAMVAMVQHDYQTALNFFEKLPEDYKVKFLAFPISDAFIRTGKPELALGILYKYKEIGINPTADVFIAKALITLNRAEDVEKIKLSLLADKSNVRSLLGAAEIADAQGIYPDAILILKKIHSELSVDSPDRVIITIRLGLIHYFHQDFQQALFWFSQILDYVIKDVDLARIHIRSLYSAKKYADAYIALQAIRESGITSIEFLEVESWLAEYFGNLKIALGLQKQLINLEPENLIYKVQLGRLEFHAGNRLEALKILRNLDLDKIQSPHELIQVAEMFDLFDEPESAIKIAYRARTIGISLPEIHVAYISLIIKAEDRLNVLFKTIPSPVMDFRWAVKPGG